MIARVVGLSGTVVITRFLAPAEFGEVTLAATLVMTGSLLSNFGLGNYYIVKGDHPEVAFHMTTFSLILAFLSLGLVWLLDEPLSAWVGVPGIAQYVPGLIAAWALRRIGGLPQKVLARDMRFRRISIARAVGEITYVVSAVFLAWAGFGGEAIVIGNVVQAAIDALIVITGVSWRTWLQPHRLQWERTKDMFRFGLPLGANALLFYVSQNALDRWVYTYFFGPSLMGLYQLGYRLAEIPAAQIGDQISDVMLPSMARLEPDARARAVFRSTALLSLVIFPLAMGLAVVAEPLVHLLLSEEWHGVAPFVTILCGISLFQPISSTLCSYLISYGRTRVLVVMETVKILAMLVGLAALSPLGPLWICIGVVAAFALQALLSAWLCVRRHGISASGLAASFGRPLLACLPMIAAVLAVRQGLRATGMQWPVVSLVIEILAGIAVYVPSAFVLAPVITRDFLHLLKKALSRAS
jgi:PST family polysaccharide transporter